MRQKILSKDNKLSHITKIKNIFKICKKSTYSIDMPAFILSHNIYYWTEKNEGSVKKAVISDESLISG
ncbi:MAG: hypothetical protein LBP85_10910 [Prevotellaceae bacterium]|jgi:hypothetical protein|nr:hypothetical protein [Prevotellaceae bacterium]